jgi:hypothetical protein
MKIFGYEPAAWAGALQALLGVLVVFNVFGLTADLSTLVQAAAGAVFALVTAFFTKKVNLAVVTGAAQALLALLVGFGLDEVRGVLLSDPALQAVLITLLQLGLAGFLRQNTEPAEEPAWRSEPLHSEPLEPDYH